MTDQNEAVQDEDARGPNNGPTHEHNLIMFTPPLPQETVARQGEPKNKELPGKENQEMNGSHKKYHIFHQEGK